MNMRKPFIRNGAGRRARGFSLIELMIAMVLGLIVIAGAGSVFLASSRTYKTNQALSDVQTNSRIAFELLARDFRNAGQTACNNNGRVANTINNPSNNWFSDWSNALRGYTASQTDPAITSAMPARAASTDSVQVIGSGTLGLSVGAPSANAANFHLNESTSALQAGDIIMVCDPDHAAIVQITTYSQSSKTVTHNVGTGSPGNCSKGMGWPTVCTTNGTPYTYGQNSAVAKLVATDWYIGKNPVGGKSLYHISVVNVGGTPTPQAQEMVRDVDDMKLTYHQSGSNDFQPANLITNWGVVDAVRVQLTLESTDKRAGMNYTPISRSFIATTTIRNRVK